MTASDRDKGQTRCDEVIAGEYVLGALSADDCRKVEARLARDHQFAVMVRRWRENLSTFSDEQEALHLPPRASATAGIPVAAATPCDVAFSGKVSGGCWNSLAFWRALAFGCFAVSVGLVLSLSALLSPRPVSGGRLLASLTGEGAVIDLVAHYDEANGALHVTPIAGGDSKQSLELWLTSQGKAPVSLGVLPQSGGGALAVPADMRDGLVQGATISVSVEPFGGSPSGKASGPVIASGMARFD